MEQIICKNVTVGYEKSAVQSNINLCIEKGDFLAVVGNNGTGKTTFMKTLLGLLSPISGNIQLADGLKFNDIGYLPQQTQRQKDFPASVWEVVLSGHINKHGLRPFYNKAEKEKSQELLEKIGIAHLKNTSYSRISGGQQQRVLLARALCALSKIIFLDEPTSALDPDSTAEMYHLLSDLNKEGLTIVMITHDIHNSLTNANKVLLFDREVSFMDKDKYISKINSCIHYTAEDTRG